MCSHYAPTVSVFVVTVLSFTVFSLCFHCVSVFSRCVCGIVAVDDPAWKSDKDFGRAALVRAANWDRMLAGDPPMKSSNEVFFQVQVS